MNGFITMLKMNLRLLLRNKGYLAFLIILPFLSVILLNAENSTITDTGEENKTVIELSKENSPILSVVNTKLTVKVYDCSDSMVSNYIVDELAKSGSYRVFRYKGEAMGLEEARDKALKSASKNIIGAVIYIPADFETQILNGSESNLVVFEATEDGRIGLLENNLDTYLQSIYRYADITGYEKDAFKTLLDTAKENEMTEETVSIEVGDTLNLSAKQQNSSGNIGYSLSFLTISFLFSGVFIAATVVEERENRVYNRILLSNTTLANYGLIKFVLVVLTVLMQTGIITVALKLLVKTDFGIPFTSYLFLVFCLGLIFNLFSVVIGVLTNNVLSSNYIAFLVWCLSCLLAGLYFPLDGASDWWVNFSYLMPQRWVVKTAELIMAQKSGAYGMYLLVVAGYLIVVVSVGLMGVKIRRKE